MKKIYVRPVSEIYDAETVEVICASNRVFGYTSDPNSPFNVEKPQPTGDDITQIYILRIELVLKKMFLLVMFYVID